MTSVKYMVKRDGKFTVRLDKLHFCWVIAWPRRRSPVVVFFTLFFFQMMMIQKVSGRLGNLSSQFLLFCTVADWDCLGGQISHFRHDLNRVFDSAKLFSSAAVIFIAIRLEFFVILQQQQCSGIKKVEAQKSVQAPSESPILSTIGNYAVQFAAKLPRKLDNFK